MSEVDIRSIMREVGISDKVKPDSIVRFAEIYHNKMKSKTKRETCALLRGKNDYNSR